MSRPPNEVREQIRRSGLEAGGPGTAWHGPSLVAVRQRTRVVEVSTAYDYHLADGAHWAVVRQVGQSTAKKVVRFVLWLDQYFTHRFEMRTTDGELLVTLTLTRPRKVFRSRVEVRDPTARPLGQLRQQNVIGKIRFELEDSEGRLIGRLDAENFRGWDFAVLAADRTEIGRVIKTWEGWARNLLTPTDHYVMASQQPLDGDLGPLVLLMPVMIDLAIKQDWRGAGGGVG